MTTVTLSTEAIQAVVQDYFAATRSMDGEAWVATFAPDGVCYDPASPPLHGHTALRGFFQQITGLFDRVGLQEEFMSIQGNEVAVKWIGRGVSKNGREVTFAGIDIFEINDQGKIQVVKGYWDPVAMMAAL
ncbi:nuclear transport factor 2 family protein [Leptodesmis sichuanensis]|uniref:nuclear transport factor 2 family protein n=1 Tax=Leptodesmis sichuanensis TaxID=2906798 RepID=UPI001F275605|nr:nuclear transport factor 2 family protein [Leptodesmis sichuanensis]UIE37715.1 nuclear transport factor 2 family protein [Leptodesmis sichuanensis A121]